MRSHCVAWCFELVISQARRVTKRSSSILGTGVARIRVGLSFGGVSADLTATGSSLKSGRQVMQLVPNHQRSRDPDGQLQSRFAAQQRVPSVAPSLDRIWPNPGKFRPNVSLEALRQ